MPVLCSKTHKSDFKFERIDALRFAEIWNRLDVSRKSITLHYYKLYVYYSNGKKQLGIFTQKLSAHKLFCRTKFIFTFHSTIPNTGKSILYFTLPWLNKARHHLSTDCKYINKKLLTYEYFGGFNWLFCLKVKW